MLTKTQNAALALAEAIRQLKSVPSGHLYAQVLGSLSMTEYTDAIGCLVRAKLVSKANHILTWTGPTITGDATL